jgi:hypothetical protein
MHPRLNLASETKEVLDTILVRFSSDEAPAISEAESGSGISYNLGCGSTCSGTCYGGCQGDCAGHSRAQLG